MGPLSYMSYVVNRNVIMQHMAVFCNFHDLFHILFTSCTAEVWELG